jgi:hypothetical protein
MPRLSKEFKQAIQEIPIDELQKRVLQVASKNPEVFDMLNLKYVSGNEAEDELYEESRERIGDEICFLGERGIIQKNLAKAITKAIGYINYFSKVTKNEVREAELLLYLLNETFKNYSDELGTCWTVFDSKLAITTNRLYNLVTKKLHEDYQIEFAAPINSLLTILHAKSSHLDYVFNMPKSMES